MSNNCIGIDLGTTYCCIGVINNDNVDIIANDQGQRTTPSYISFTEEERLIGAAAKSVASRNPKNTIYDAKRLIGRNFDEQCVKNDMKLWSFDVVSGSKNNPLIKVEYKNKEKLLTPEEVSSMLLIHLKETAEAFIGDKVTKAVITVPAYFNDAQRKATKDAGRIAGLEVLRIINEPTAAALAYGLQNKKDKEQNVLIFDLGGGTFDVSILTIDDGIFEVKSTAGDTHLGGEDFDNVLVEICLKEFIKKYKDKEIKNNVKAIRKLKTACETAKRTLSTTTVTTIEIDSLHNGIDFTYKITRAKFESECTYLFKKCMAPIDKVLLDAELSKGYIDEVVLVGGSTRVPKIQAMLSDYFNNKALCKSINPDEAIAYGAAIQASILSGNDNSLTKDLLLLDVTPLSLGIETAGEIMTTLISRNTSVPTKKTQVFSTYADNQEAVTLNVFEGERQFVRDNNKLGTFDLQGIPPMPRGVPQIEITYDVDANGILTVSAIEKSTGKTQDITITNDNNRLNKDEIDEMIQNAEKFKEDDENRKVFVESKNKYENYLYSVKSSLTDLDSKLSEDDKVTLNKNIEENEEWLQSNSQLDLHDDNKEIYNERYEALTSKLSPILSKYSGQEQGMPGGMPGGGSANMPVPVQEDDEPTIESVD
jgi:heat shock 70kDa protein 1/2/6/8